MKTFLGVKQISACLGIALLFGAAAPAKALPRTTSSIVIDALSGEVISSSNADEQRYPASLTKLMTLYITFSELEQGNLKLDDKLKVSRYAANRSPSRIGVRAGETITVKDAVLALIVKSANDCAAVLAEAIGGSEENFAKIMTQTAKDLGMKHTTFKNASGLPHRQQKTWLCSEVPSIITSQNIMTYLPPKNLLTKAQPFTPTTTF